MWWKLKAKETQQSRSDKKPCVLETGTTKTNLAESSCSSVSDSRRSLVKQSRYQDTTPGFTTHESSRGRKQKRTLSTPVSPWEISDTYSELQALWPGGQLCTSSLMAAEGPNLASQIQKQRSKCGLDWGVHLKSGQQN
ncbi:unnamed protein product [Rangifer tarandus platyrhynchus]|uniref:Uncharacterized protein n=1 Tax=Rangifer tarandus platyrhynchus TaxID=3082113 RepID=A0AC60A260_RANTA